MFPEDDITKELRRLNVEVGSDDAVCLLHATDASGAEGILAAGSLRTDNYGHAYVSTAPSISADLGRDVIVPVRVEVARLSLTRAWNTGEGDAWDRADFAVTTPAGKWAIVLVCLGGV